MIRMLIPCLSVETSLNYHQLFNFLILMNVCGIAPFAISQFQRSVPILQIQINLKIKMAYLQQFFDQHLPLYYLNILKTHQNRKDFLDFNSSFNLYSITLDLLNLAHHQSTNYFTRQWLSTLINRQFMISFNDLREYRIPLQDSDSQIVRMLKSCLQYVHNMLLQLVLRVLAIFLECYQSQYLNDASLSLIQELGNIYPALKAEISINCPQINLNDFLEKYLTLVVSSCNGLAGLLALEKIKVSCHFIGATEKLINRIIAQKKQQIHNINKRRQLSSQQSEEDSEKISKRTKQNLNGFNQVETSRKSKGKPLAKITLKHSKSMMTVEATPLKSGTVALKDTPQSQKTKGKAHQQKSKDVSKSPLKKTPLFKKIRKQKKPLERTIYFGETKRFIPKKHTTLEDSFEIKQLIRGTVIPDNRGSFRDCKKTERKFFEQKQDGNVPLFFVPETPRASSYATRNHQKIIPSNLFKVK